MRNNWIKLKMDIGVDLYQLESNPGPHLVEGLRCFLVLWSEVNVIDSGREHSFEPCDFWFRGKIYDCLIKLTANQWNQIQGQTHVFFFGQSVPNFGIQRQNDCLIYLAAKSPKSHTCFCCYPVQSLGPCWSCHSETKCLWEVTQLLKCIVLNDRNLVEPHVQFSALTQPHQN